MAKYLDDNGLLYFWQKIKSLFAQKTDVPTKLSDLTNDANYVTDANYVHTDNNYTTDEKTKLSGIATGAQVNVIETVKVNGTAQSVTGKAVDIKVPTKLSELTNDDNFVKDVNYVHTDNNYTSSEKTKLAGFSDASNYALKTDISGMYKYKGSVATASALPTSGQETGDVYNIEAASTYGGAGMNVAWDGSKWDPLGEIFSIATVTNAEIDTIVAS